jgi:ribonuclease VapC
MPLYIRDEGVAELARRAKDATGAKTVTEAVRAALERALKEVKGPRGPLDRRRGAGHRGRHGAVRSQRRHEAVHGRIVGRMSAFIDASVIVAIVSREADAASQAARVTATVGPIYISSIVLYEATISVARKKALPGASLSADMVAEARKAVAAFVAEIGAVEIRLAGEITERAIDASLRFGKIVKHPARLNMCDCFAYACAQSRNLPLLFKGDDFSQTDIRVA